jgi:hypothetical protein
MFEYLALAWDMLKNCCRCCFRTAAAIYDSDSDDPDMDFDDNQITTVDNTVSESNNVHLENPTVTTTSTSDDHSKVTNNLRSKSTDNSRTSTEIHIAGGTVYIYQSNENQVKNKNLQVPVDQHDMAIANEGRPRSLSDSAVIPPTPNMELIAEAPLVEVNDTALANFIHDNMDALLDGHEMAIAGASSSHLMYDSAGSSS